MDGFLLQSVEALEASPFAAQAGGIWESLQAEKEEVSRDLLGSGPLLQEAVASAEIEPPEECAQEIEWRHRGKLEDRLRVINDAQDRLIDGGYGVCLDCGRQIDQKRLLADSAASLCLVCQQLAEGELRCCSL